MPKNLGFRHMRIVGGAYRGRKLEAPADDTVRPTTDRVREAIFNILGHNQPPLPRGAKVLDLFSGTGAFGLEALSRGAAQTVFVDRAMASLNLSKNNARNLGVMDQCTFVKADASNLKGSSLFAESGAAGLVFADPPYDRGLLAPALVSGRDAGWIDLESYILAETASRETVDLGPDFEVTNEWTYGYSKITRISLAR